MNILMFGPNGSGKGTQGAILKGKFKLPHIESGAIFRENIGKGTELGAKAKEYIDRGDLVPDDITIPMILDRLKQDDCKEGWLLDGFPRNKTQAIKLDEALKTASLGLDVVVEVLLDREIAKWAAGSASMTTTIPTTSSLMPSSRTAISAGFAVETSLNALTTRTKAPSVNVTAFTTTRTRGPWPPLIISKISLKKRARSNILPLTVPQAFPK